MAPLRVVVMANWGLGREIVAALHRHEGVELAFAVTATAKKDADPWSSAVADFCEESGIEVMDAECSTLDQIGARIRECAADLLFTHAYMRKIPRAVFAAPRMGTVNVHPSLLPKYRGPSPGYWALANGEAETGLTAHFMDEGWDTGPIIHQERVPLTGGEDAAGLIEKLKTRAEPLVRATIDKIMTPGFVPARQNESEASYAPRPRKVTI